MSIPRNCYRCGSDFHSIENERVCPMCRKGKDGELPLTSREKQVVELVRQAKLNKEIAYELHLTVGTVKEYLNRIYRKAGTRNRTELAVWAMLQHREA